MSDATDRDVAIAEAVRRAIRDHFNEKRVRVAHDLWDKVPRSAMTLAVAHAVVYDKLEFAISALAAVPGDVIRDAVAAAAEAAMREREAK